MTAPPVTVTHAQFQEQVIALAHALGWRHLHVRRSIGGRTQGWKTTTNIKGWPDLWLFHPGRGGFVAVELKVGKDTPTPEQLTVLTELAAAGAQVMVAYPADWDELQSLLVTARGTSVASDPPTKERT